MRRSPASDGAVSDWERSALISPRMVARSRNVPRVTSTVSASSAAAPPPSACQPPTATASSTMVATATPTVVPADGHDRVSPGRSTRSPAATPSSITASPFGDRRQRHRPPLPVDRDAGHAVAPADGLPRHRRAPRTRRRGVRRRRQTGRASGSHRRSVPRTRATSVRTLSDMPGVATGASPSRRPAVATRGVGIERDVRGQADGHARQVRLVQLDADAHRTLGDHVQQSEAGAHFLAFLWLAQPSALPDCAQDRETLDGRPNQQPLGVGSRRAPRPGWRGRGGPRGSALRPGPP